VIPALKTLEDAVSFDLATHKLRELNSALAALPGNTNQTSWHVKNPRGEHAIAVGVTVPVAISIDGHVGYYCAGMNDGAEITVLGNAAARCGLSMKGVDIVVKGSVGHMSGFMAQSGNLVILGDAGEALGDSLYEAKIFLRGNAAGLGADCEEKPFADADYALLAGLLKRAGAPADVAAFKLYGSARTLYHFHVDNAGAY